MAKIKYPYLNLSLKNIKGEKWQDLPGLDGCYLISNFGRVKRLAYEMQYKNGAIYLKPEKIIKPGVVKQRNNYKNDYKYFLVNRVTLNGIRYNLSIARLVYHCFVQSFEIDNRNSVIIYRDDDSFNIKPSNLITVSLREKQKRISTRKRGVSPFTKLSKKFRSEIRKKIVRSVSKQVSQYSLEGRKMKTFNSMAEAQRVTGVFATSIAKVATGKGNKAGGFIWKWGRNRKCDPLPIRKTKKD